jgi:hypothetical protein
MGTRDKILFFCPVFVNLLGIGLHVLGIFERGIGDAPIKDHFLMLTVDSIALVGILSRKKWGYYFSLALFTYAVISQTYWTIEAIVKKYDAIGLQALMASMCIVVLTVLVTRRDMFVRATFNSASSLFEKDS